MESLMKRQKVNQYLEQLYGDEPIPEFELNDQTISYLYEFSKISQKNEKNTELLIEDLQQKTDEYNALSKQFGTIIDDLGLGPKHLSKSGSNSLTTLCKLGTLLNFSNASESNYYLALQDLDDEQYRVEQKLLEEEIKLKKFTSKASRAISKVESLESTLALIEQSTAEEVRSAETRMKDDTPYYKKKAKAYEKDIGKLKMIRIDPNISHENLVKKSQILAKLKSELEPLQKELQSYLVLPPNISETKILIEEKKRELSELDKELGELVQSVD